MTTDEDVQRIAFEAYVSGIGTGIKSAAFNLARGGMTALEASDLAQAAVHGYMTDPLQRLAIENTVAAIVAGKPSPTPQGAAIPPTETQGEQWW